MRPSLSRPLRAILRAAERAPWLPRGCRYSIAIECADGKAPSWEETRAAWLQCCAQAWAEATQPAEPSPAPEAPCAMTRIAIRESEARGIKSDERAASRERFGARRWWAESPSHGPRGYRGRPPY
jgi:hypothetical protein